MLLAIAIIVAAALAGFLFERLIGKAAAPLRWFDVATFSICIVSVALIILAECSSLWPASLLTLLALTAAVLLGTCAIRRIELFKRAYASLSMSATALAAVLVFAAVLRYPGSPYFIGGQDPGVYENSAASIGRTGSLAIADPLSAIVASDPALQREYRDSSFHSYAENSAGHSWGSFLPGYYFRDGTIVAQFFHLQTLWFAASAQLFGLPNTQLPLLLFALWTIWGLYVLTLELTSSRVAALLTSALAAGNSAMCYFSRLPVSETVAGAFFIASIYFLVRTDRDGWRAGLAGGLAWGCFCFTRISGAIFLPLLAVCCLWIQVQSRKRDTRLGALVLLLLGTAMFVWGHTHALAFSRPYTEDIFARQFGLGPRLLPYLFLPWLLLDIIAIVLYRFPGRLHSVLSRAIALLYKFRRPLVILCCGAFLAVITVRGYLLGYTNFFGASEWLNRRWRLSGNGEEAIDNLSVVTLLRFSSPLVLVAGAIGLYRTALRALSSPRHFVLALFGFSTAAMYTIAQIATPYLYYFGRYLVSELLPLVLVFCGIFTAALARRLPRRWAATPWIAVYGAAFLWFSPYTQAQASSVEMQAFTRDLQAFHDRFPENAVLFQIGSTFPQEELGTPLIVALGRKVWRIRNTEGDVTPIFRFAPLLQQHGLEVYAILNRPMRQQYRDRFERLPYQLFHLRRMRPDSFAILPHAFDVGFFRLEVYRLKPADQASQQNAGALESTDRE